MKNKYIILLFLAFTGLYGCSDEEEYDLRESVFIEDVEYKGLPQYTEWGYNTFGAYYDREVFVSNNSEVPVKLFVTDGKSSFIFHGQKGSSGTDMRVTFKFDNFLPTEFSDILVLNDSTMNLDTPNAEVEIVIDEQIKECVVINGNMHFKRVQELFVDGEHRQIILSGYFEFQVLIDNYPIAISDGRFDIGIGYSNFFVF